LVFYFCFYTPPASKVSLEPAESIKNLLTPFGSQKIGMGYEAVKEIGRYV